MRITHRQIEIFRALMVTGSVTRAAELLFTSQPTISRELARIEQVFGFFLFDRILGRLRPTTSALTLYEEIKRTYVGLERVTAVIARLRECDGGQLSVITQPVFSHTLLPGACRRLLASHPGAKISIEAQEPPFLDEWLSAQRFDLGLTEHDTPPAGTRLTPLLQVDEVCVLPEAHPHLAKRMITLAELVDQPFIGLPPGDPYRIKLDAIFASLGVSRRMVVEAPTSVSVCALVCKGVGVAIVNPLTALDFEGRGLHIRPLAVSHPFRVNLIQPEHRPRNPLAAACVTALHEEASRLEQCLKALRKIKA